MKLKKYRLIVVGCWSVYKMEYASNERVHNVILDFFRAKYFRIISFYAEYEFYS